MKRVIILGGYGVFGSHIARALTEWRVPLTIAGRDRQRAEAAALALGGTCQARDVDVTKPESCRAALAGHGVAVQCAGPFDRADAILLEACLETGCHYTDLADHRGYIAMIQALGPRFTAQGLAAVYGCSSLPGISGALAAVAREQAPAPVERVRVTLFIGNKNPKGQAAVRTLVAGLGMPIVAPQGTLLGFHDGEVVPLPPPFGRRRVFNVEGPEYDLFPKLLDTKAVVVKVGFELRLGTWMFAALAKVGRGYGPRLVRLLDVPSRLLGWIGCSGGAVMTELFLADGTVRRVALAGTEGGQRMAALPCAFVARALSSGSAAKIGASTAYEFFGARTLLDLLVQAGFELHTS